MSAIDLDNLQNLVGKHIRHIPYTKEMDLIIVVIIMWPAKLAFLLMP